MAQALRWSIVAGRTRSSPGKRPGPVDGTPGTGSGIVKEGPAARREIDKAAHRARDRSFLERIDPSFREMSPERGMLDEAAVAEAMGVDLDHTLARLADAASTSDEVLRRLAKRLAGRVIVRLGNGAGDTRRGIGRLARRPWADGGDLDIDASIPAIVDGLAARQVPDERGLIARSWVRDEHALCLLVDKSGSMGGQRLVMAALAAAVVACRAPSDHSVVAFAGDAVVIKSQDVATPIDVVIDDLLALHGYGTTDLALALRVGQAQLARSRARRKVAVLLSDGMSTAGVDPLLVARGFDALHVLAPQGDAPAARALARAGGGRFAQISRPSELPEVLVRLLG